ncbi:MAG TPA: 16S rRNA (guanine(966)-N(2))-methyltransferase RsmD [Caulobacteraceae bacterium]|jgi:16S rRNA (guanine966-N2)-methyltransferase|nr:16S rRNA (guanine(966)-N(2))-methyltransferase RsmD [Caulobacteraceae bacterium]
MRIVAGAFRGRALTAPRGQATRPTADRTREAVFNILEHAPWSPGLAGRRVMDLFAGSGALGLEALSRGAAFCLFVETDEAARGAIRQNIEALGLFGVTRLHRRDATQLGPKPVGDGPAFDLAFLDPPYGKGLAEAALAALAAGRWLTPGALAVVERGGDEPALAAPGYSQLDARDYGAARVWFLRLEEAGA